MTEPTLPDTLEDGWKERGACRDQSPRYWYPAVSDQGRYFRYEREARKDINTALAICAGCEVKSQCLLYALIHEHDYWATSGIFGGMTPPQRGALRRSLALRGLSPQVVRVRSPRGRPS